MVVSLHLDVGIFNFSCVIDYVRCMELGIQQYLGMGRFAIAAKHVSSLAEFFETQVVDLEKAIKYYEQVREMGACVGERKRGERWREGVG